MLTRQREKDRIAHDRTLRVNSNKDIAIYNCKSSMLCNPFAGDTTVLDWSTDNHRDVVPQTEDEILDSIFNPKHNLRVRKSDVKLVPEMVSEEVKDYYLQKIKDSALRSAKSYARMW